MADERDQLLLELYGLIFSLEEEDLLDTQFMNNYAMKPTHDSTFFLVLVGTFFEEVQDALCDLGSALKDCFVCFADIYVHYTKVKGIVQSFGASAMRQGLEELHCSILGASVQLGKSSCASGFENLRPHLGAITRLECRIIYPERTLAGDSDSDDR
ncbi:hypothetical protein ACJRO7_028742 [Eucalyptus globulus]|uniref:Uncharacterized protein n=1 Tax=Eucalyptus globulus TaxID=34317 RepID=A0ABD3K8H0_EUCGL